MNVTQYFERRYRRRYLEDQSPLTLSKYRLAIRRLGEVLGREAGLTDLDDKNISTVAAWLIEHGRSRDRARAIWKVLRAIACEARREGLQVGEIARSVPGEMLEFKAHKQVDGAPALREYGPSQATVKAVRKAAELHTRGEDLRKIARKVKRNPKTVLRWQYKYAEIWDPVARQVRNEQIREIYGVELATEDDKEGAA